MFARHKTKIAIIVGGWSLWALVRLAESWLNHPAPGSLDWGTIAFRQYLAAIGWMLVTPAILWVTEYFWKRKQVPLAIMIHSGNAVVLLLFRAFLHAMIAVLFLGGDMNPQFQGSVMETGIAYSRAWAFGSMLHYCFIAAAYTAFLWFVEYKKAESERTNLKLKSQVLERQLSDARLMALRMQLNPHFLFNTLHSVASLVRLQEKDKAISTITHLSDMLRYTVYEGSKNLVPAREEIAFLKDYLKIEEIRFQDRLRIQWDIQEDALDFPLPNLLLQPIVENSIKHGLKQMDDGELSISLRRSAENCIIQIEDNGAGLPVVWDLQKCAGIGLQNTMARLTSLYGDQYTFSISHRNDQGGTRVTIVVPQKKNDHEPV